MFPGMDGKGCARLSAFCPIAKSQAYVSPVGSVQDLKSGGVD